MNDIVMIDYSEYFEEVISNQQTQIELLEQQNQILLEQINGFSIVSTYLNMFFIIALVVIGVVLLWNILNKWFFRGV